MPCHKYDSQTVQLRNVTGDQSFKCVNRNEVTHILENASSMPIPQTELLSLEVAPPACPGPREYRRVTGCDCGNKKKKKEGGKEERQSPRVMGQFTLLQ